MFRNGNARRGFSMVEMIIVLAVMGILGSIVTLNFSRMNHKAEAERQMRTLHSDLFAARIQSVQQGKRHAIRIGSTSYTFTRYSSEEEPLEAGRAVLTKNLVYPVCDGSGDSLNGKTIEFDTRGYTTFWNTIRLVDETLSESLDCVVIHSGRINSGKMKNRDCNAR